MTADDIQALERLVSSLPTDHDTFIEKMEATWDGSASEEFWVIVQRARLALRGAPVP